MPGSLEGKVAVVTGVSHAGQVGQAVAKDLAAQGAALVICARTQANVEARATELREEGARVHAVAASLTEEPDVLRLIDETLAAYSRIDILVNLAGGLTLYKPAVEFSLADWNRELNNNLLSAFLVSRAAFPHMANAGSGSIVNFARAGLSQANMVAYSCAKAGVEALTRTFALEGRDAGIRVNAVAPGLVDTEFEHRGHEAEGHETVGQARRHCRGSCVPCLARIRGHHRAGDRSDGLGHLTAPRGGLP